MSKIIFLLSFLFSIGAQAITWMPYKNMRFGFEVYYPDTFLSVVPDPEAEPGRTFVSSDGSAQITAYAMLDSWALGPHLYLERIIKGEGRIGKELAQYVYPNETQPYAHLVDVQVTDYSLRLVGRRGTQVYYEEFLFSCKDKVINMMSLTFDESKSSEYEPLFEKMSRKFGAGSGTDSPPCM